MAGKNVTMTPEMVEHLLTWIDEVNAIMAGRRSVSVSWEEGLRYHRIWAVSDMGDWQSRSCYAFIDKATGDVYRPATWRAPAKHVRGNITVRNTAEYCGPYGVAYLR